MPNMENIGSTGELAHGPTFFFFVSVPFVALSLDTAALSRTRPSGGKEWARIPADRVIDALAIGSNYPAGGPDCPPLVNARFDRRESRVRGSDEVAEYSFSVARRAAPGLPGVLQHTRSGHTDFVRTARSPGTLSPAARPPQ